jgi:hypothetical protein
MSCSAQPEFNFEMTTAANGLNAWREQRRAATVALAEKLGLPLGQRVEVRLLDGAVTQGLLTLREETLFLDRVDATDIELAVGRMTFRHSEVESCVRLD